MMSLQILDDAQKRAPTALTVVVSGAWENSPIDFSIDTEVDPVYQAFADEGGEINAISIPVPGTTTAGVHGLIARSVSIGTDADQVATDDFTLLYPASHGHVVGPDVDPVEVPGALNFDGSRNWVLQDLLPGGLGSYIFLRNPRTLTTPEVNRDLSARHTTAVSGRHHITEANDQTSEMTFTGLAFTEGEHQNLANYFALNRRLYLIDHDNRAWIVAFNHVDVTHRLRTRFQLPGQVAQLSDWVAEYTVTTQVYGTWVQPVPL